MYKIDRRGGVQKSYTRTDLIASSAIYNCFNDIVDLKFCNLRFSRIPMMWDTLYVINRRRPSLVKRNFYQFAKRIISLV